jgi:hypothetical protein
MDNWKSVKKSTVEGTTTEEEDGECRGKYRPKWSTLASRQMSPNVHSIAHTTKALDLELSCYGWEEFVTD